MKFSSASIMAMMALTPFVSAQQQCFDESGTPVGDAGAIEIKREDSFVGLSFERTSNGAQCPCSYIDLECKIAGTNTDCSDLIVDARNVGEASDYPDVRVNYGMKLCNYNTRNTINLERDPEKKVELEFYHPDPLTNIDSRTFNGVALPSGTCEDVSGSVTLNSARAKYFMKGILQGGQTDAQGSRVQDGFCYAYAYNKIDFKYNYGLAPCQIETTLTCTPEDTSVYSTCEEYIIGNCPDGVECPTFTGTFTGSACNRTNRDVKVQVGASNFKLNTYTRNNRGKYVRDIYNLPEEIASGECASFSVTKEIDATEGNFWQINMKGLLYDEDAAFAQYFKHKECASYSFDELPKVDPIREGNSSKGKSGKNRGRNGRNGGGRVRRRRAAATA